jgi:predicted nucleic acid-binding protein
VTTFCDASAILKHYVPEAGAAVVTGLDGRLVVSDLSAVEVPSAIWRKQRIGELAAEDASVLVAAFGHDLRGGAYEAPRYATVALGTDVLDRAADLLPRHGLRAGDAIQLASAIAARASLEFCDTFVTFDRRLGIAAAAEGFSVIPSPTDLESS